MGIVVTLNRFRGRERLFLVRLKEWCIRVYPITFSPREMNRLLRCTWVAYRWFTMRPCLNSPACRSPLRVKMAWECRTRRKSFRWNTRRNPCNRTRRRRRGAWKAPSRPRRILRCREPPSLALRFVNRRLVGRRRLKRRGLVLNGRPFPLSCRDRMGERKRVLLDTFVKIGDNSTPHLTKTHQERTEEKSSIPVMAPKNNGPQIRPNTPSEKRSNASYGTSPTVSPLRLVPHTVEPFPAKNSLPSFSTAGTSPGTAHVNSPCNYSFEIRAFGTPPRMK